MNEKHIDLSLSPAEKSMSMLKGRYGKWSGDDSKGIFDISDPGKFALEFNRSWGGEFSPWDDRVRVATGEDPFGTALHELLHANAFSDDYPPGDWPESEGRTQSYRGIEISRVIDGCRELLESSNTGLNEGVSEHLVRLVYLNAAKGYPKMIPYVDELLRVLGEERLERAYFAEVPVWVEREFDRESGEEGVFRELSVRADRALR
jgi:hypothetical protein